MTWVEVLNEDFTSNDAGVFTSLGTGWAVANNQLERLSGTSASVATATYLHTSGELYKCDFDFTSTTLNATLQVRSSTTNVAVFGAGTLAGSQSFQYNAPNAGNFIFRAVSSCRATIDNVVLSIWVDTSTGGAMHHHLRTMGAR